MDATWRGSCVALPALPSLLENSPLLFSFLSFFNKVRDETWKFAIFKTDIAVSRSPRTRSSVRFAWRCLDFESDDFVLYVESWNNIFSIPTVLRVFDDWTKKQLHWLSKFKYSRIFLLRKIYNPGSSKRSVLNVFTLNASKEWLLRDAFWFFFF